MADKKLLVLQDELEKKQQMITALEDELHSRDLAHGIAERENKVLFDSLSWKILDRVTNFINKVPGIGFVNESLNTMNRAKQISSERRILINNVFFDESFYIANNDFGQMGREEALTHFLTVGMQSGAWPNGSFDPQYYLAMYPDVAASGVNPLVHYIVSGEKEGRLTYKKDSNDSGEKNIGPDAGGTYFDPEFYAKVYPDVGGLDPLFHYNRYGRQEGRLPCEAFPFEFHGIDGLDPDKETIVYVSHNASRSGGPLLSLKIIEQLGIKYNVVSVLLSGGEVIEEFESKSDILIKVFPGSNSFLFAILLGKLLLRIKIKFALVNTVESRYVLPVLANCFIPSLCLIHEFASYIRPKSAISEVVLWASEVVFSADIVYEDSSRYCDALKNRSPAILAQGQCAGSKTEFAGDNENQEVQERIRPGGLSDETVVVLGAGNVEYRKGIDVFITCAAKVRELNPDSAFRFVWAGDGFDPEGDTLYSSFIQDQISRYGLQDNIVFLGELPDITQAYHQSDIFFLSSRLDPLPNVAIDAMFNQIPVLCFDNTSGIADLLLDNDLGNDCVVPYLDVDKAGQQLKKLIDNPEDRIRLGLELKQLATKLFNMDSYVESLEKLALHHVSLKENEKSDCLFIEKSRKLDLEFFLPPNYPSMNYGEAIRLFVRSWHSGEGLRKPFPGFHPGIYIEEKDNSPDYRNPLVDFIELGCPSGPWMGEILEPSSASILKGGQDDRIALHIHVYYEDLFEAIFERLERQEANIDLLISVANEKAANNISTRLQSYRNGDVEICVVPNSGRDIGPFLTEFNETILNNYQIIGHVHTKKSRDINDAVLIDKWFTFLLDNLVGSEYPMASLITEKLAIDDKLGLIFPDDPYVVGWTKNKSIARELGKRLGVKDLPERFFNFPVGSMFWAKTDAIRPLLEAGFNWNDYPSEPIPSDGTVLHALERLIPSVVKTMGYEVEMTYVPGCTR